MYPPPSASITQLFLWLDFGLPISAKVIAIKPRDKMYPKASAASYEALLPTASQHQAFVSDRGVRGAKQSVHQKDSRKPELRNERTKENKKETGD